MAEHSLAKAPQPDRDQLIESIYRIALEPQTYDAFMGTWDSYISSQSADLVHLRESGEGRTQVLNHPELATHFQIAEQLLTQMGRPDPNTAESGDMRNPQLLIDTQGRIVWSSSAATPLFGIPLTATISDLTLDAENLTALEKMAQGLPDGVEQTRPGPLLLSLRRKGSNRDTVFYMVARILPEQDGTDVILLTKVAPDWPPGMDRLLAQGFALTKAEIEICELLAQGQNPAEIAETRSSAIGTVRTQLKKLLSKTHCSSQVDVVRLLHSIMRVAESSKSHQAQAWSYAERTSSVTLPDRVMPIEHYGDPNGTPVLFFHGMLDGNTMNSEMRQLLRQHKFRLICPIRPWFGTASGSAGPASDAPERFARDIRHLMDTLGLRDVVLMGHMAGAVYAHAAARLLPTGYVRGIVNISGAVPIVSVKQFASMSNRQRLVAYTARYTPAILPFVLRAGISQLDNGGERTFLHSLYENAPHDLDILRDPETRDMMLAGFRFTVQQGHKAFEIDGYTVVRDWTEWVAPTDIPVYLLHGHHDPVVSYDSVVEFTARYSTHVHLHDLPETGQLVLYKNPANVVHALNQARG